jgi:prevent-host-death family protein
MATFSVADAKNKLPSLIDRALEGEEVVITRHGKPVVELRPAMAAPRGDGHATHEWFFSRRLPSVGKTSVEILDEMYEEAEREQDERLFGHQRPNPKPGRRTRKPGS